MAKSRGRRKEGTHLLNPEEEGKRVEHWQKKINEFVGCPFLSPAEIVRDLIKKDVYKFQGPPKTTLSKDEEKAQESLSPTVVPIGPSHYDIAKSSFFIEGNVLKVDAIRFVIEKGDPSEKDWERRFQTLVQHMISKEEDIRKFYDLSDMHLKGEIFAWLTIVDCCFLLAMWSVLSGEIEGPDSSFYSEYLEDGDILQTIIEDMIKLQNQMPLWVVKEVAQGLPGWEPGVIKEEVTYGLRGMEPQVVEEVTHGLAGLQPQVVEEVTHGLPPVAEEVTHYGLPGWEPPVVEVVAHSLRVPDSDIKKHFISRRVHMPKLLKRINPHGNDGGDFSLLDDDNINQSHLLRLLHYDVVGNPDNQNLFVWGGQQQKSATSLTSKLLFECRGFLDKNVVLVMLIPFIFPLLIALALPAILVAYILPHPARKGGIPSLRAKHVLLFLQNMGTRKTTMLALPELFTEKRISLPLPVKASEKEQVLIRNMIALERRNPQLKKRVSNFVNFMSEFLGDPEDVEVLETADILGTRVDENKVVEMWKSLAKWATYRVTPYKDPYDPITVLRRKLFKFSKESKPSRQAVMWYRLGTWYGDFKRHYFSNAWITVSTVGAIILLFMTAAQVACLFVSCSTF